jgi:hypothetical protein
VRSGYKNPMKPKPRFLLLAAVLIAGALLCSCASRRPVPLPEQIRDARGLTVGVALDRICPPEMRIEGLPTGGAGPYGTVPGILGRHDRDRWYGDARHPIPLSDKRKLERYLREGDADVFREIQDRLVKELSAGGWNAVALKGRVKKDGLPRFEGHGSGYAERDYRGVAPGEGLDALIVIDCRWYGMHCHYIDYYHQGFTDAAARFQGQMIDLSTNRLLWRSPEVGVRNSVPCKCNEPGDYPCIKASLHQAALEASSGLLEDLLGGGP